MESVESRNTSWYDKDSEEELDAPDDMLEPQREAPPKPWLLLWSLHYYILGLVYFCLACYALYSISLYFRRSSAPKKVSNIQSCILAIKILLFILGFSRTLYMYLYLQFWYDTGVPWKIIENILSNLAYPCLTGGFGLMCLILYEASRLKARSSSKVLHNKIVLIFIIIVHFIAVIIAVTLIEILDSFVLMLLICHGFFVLWGVLLIFTFIIFATKLTKAERKSSGVLAEMKEKESVSYGVSTVVTTVGAVNYQNFSNQSTPQQSVKDVPGRGDPQRPTVLDDVDKSVSIDNENETSRCDENVAENGTLTDSAGIQMGKKSAEEWGEDGFEKKYESQESGISRLRSKVLNRFTTTKSEANTTRLAFRVKLTRKVLRIAKITAFLNAICVVLNTFVIIRGLMIYYCEWRMTATAIYIFNTCFRCVLIFFICL